MNDQRVTLPLTGNLSDSSIHLTLTVVISTLVAVAILLASFPKHDPREPPLYKPTIPVLGHVIGFAVYRLKYIDHIALTIDREKFPDGIFTVNLFRRKVYVLCDPSLVVAVQKKTRASPDHSLLLSLGAKLAGLTREKTDIVLKDMNHPQINSMFLETRKSFYTSLGPGASLDSLKTDFFAKMELSQGRLYQMVKSDPVTLDMFLWISENFIKSTTYMLWGQKNPFELYPDLWKDFITFDQSAARIVSNSLASHSVKDGIAARAKIGRLLCEYWRDPKITPSAFEGNNHRIASTWGMTDEDIGFRSMSFIVAAVSNTIPAIYGVLGYICKDPQLLSDVRAEVDTATFWHEKQASVNLHKLRDQCPVLTSTVYEVLRYISFATMFREVFETTTIVPTQISEAHTLSSNPTAFAPIRNQYVLEKGAQVVIPGVVFHQSPDIFPDPGVFNPRRFVETPVPEIQLRGQFRTFGGGFHICAGRHLAIAEIVATVAGLVSKFDLLPVDGEGRSTDWVVPSRKDNFGHPRIPRPTSICLVQVSRRKGWEDIDWHWR